MEYPYVEDDLVYFNEDLIVVNEDVEMRWNGRNKKYYVGLGYIFTKIGDTFHVHVQDLQKGSGMKVQGICPSCKRERLVIFNSLIKFGHSNCQGCSQFIDRTGHKYEFCTIIKYHKQDKWYAAIWECLCYCGDTFYTRGSNLESGHTTSCGCRNRELASKRLGNQWNINNPNWNFNLTQTDRESNRNTPEDRYWRHEIKIKDNYTCQCCGKRGVYLESHHLNGYKDFPEQRLNLENGVTLCKTCHITFHSWMGGTSTKCTRQDFINFCQAFYPKALFL